MVQLSDSEIQNLSIEKFIFHVVHHQADEPILLNETPIGKFENFFLGRVRETLRGNRFVFAGGSPTRTALKTIIDDDRQFVSISKLLAQSFHAGRDRRIKPGVLIVMILRTGTRTISSLIKYDHEEAVTYDITTGAKAILKEIANSFTKSADALHKSALIEIDGDTDSIVVIDRTVRQDITDFFRSFLTCKRKFTPGEMTKTVEDVVVEVVKRHKDILPPEITQSVKERYFNSVQNRDNFDANEFFAEYFGSHGLPEVKKSFDTMLEKRGLDGESFKFEKTAVKLKGPRKYKTAEGVKIEIPEQASDTFERQMQEDGSTLIKIRTTKLTEQ